MSKKTVYTCGSSRCVRGNCGHFHISLRGAIRCLGRDQAGCASQRGYSDREIIAIDKDGEGNFNERPLDESEIESIYAN